MRFYLKGMEVLIRRHKPYQECQEEVSYDEWLVKHIVGTIQCRPPYWSVPGEYPICQSKEDLYMVQKLFGEIFYGTKELKPPCNEISKLDIEYEEQDPATDVLDNQTSLTVFFRSNRYKEIIQIRAYTFMSLIGNVGGFIGLLLGCALVQIPGALRTIYNILKTKVSEKIEKSANVTIFDDSGPLEKD